jgi:hypothetical protein
MEKKYKISEESAQEQINIFTDAGMVEIDDITDHATREGLLSSLNVLKRAIMRGFLEVSLSKNGELKVIQNLQRNPDKTIEYKEMTGEAKIIMGKASDDNNYEKAYTLLGYLSGLGVDGIKKLRGIDLSIAECLSAVFLGI